MLLKLLATAILCFTIAGCGEVFEKTEVIAIDKVPEAVIKVAKEKLPGVKFDTAWTEKDGDKTVYDRSREVFRRQDTRYKDFTRWIGPRS